MIAQPLFVPHAQAPILLHNKEMAAAFLSVLDQDAQEFTFQFFSDHGSGPARVLHGSLDEAWNTIEQLNSAQSGMGVFVTINQTDLRGRKKENIVEVRALWVDADDADQVKRCEDAITACGVSPTAVVRTSPGRGHYYWCCDEVEVGSFSAIQAALAQKMGTDGSVKDLSRVMRLPGTLHLKNPATPHLVTLDPTNPGPRRKADELLQALGLLIDPSEAATVTSATRLPDATRKLLEKFGVTYPPPNDLGAGIETNVEEIRSAVSAIPPAAIATELDWTRFARGLAHEARIFSSEAEGLWKILDDASRIAPGYDHFDNQQRWSRYISEALNRDNPITIATVFDIANKHGWQGWSPEVTSLGNSKESDLKITFSAIPHRQWLYGIDLVAGEITVLASPGGIGKTSLAIGMAVSLATGRSLLGEKVFCGPTKTLYINGEDSAVEMSRRIWAFCLQHKIAETDIGSFLLLGANHSDTKRLTFLRTQKGNSELDQEGISNLEALLNKFKPKVLIIDPLVTFCGGGNINDNAAMAMVMRALKALADKFGCAILVLHHTRKGGDLSSAEAIGGASAIVNLARRALMVLPMTQEECNSYPVLPSERRAYIKVAAAKANLAPHSGEEPWYRLSNTTLPNAEPPIYPLGDGVQAVERVLLTAAVQPPSAKDMVIRRAILDLVDRGKDIGGNFYPYSPATTGAKNDRAITDDAIDAIRKATAPQQWQQQDLKAVVSQVLKALTSEGWLKGGMIKSDPYRRGSTLQVDWNRTPWSAEHRGASSEAILTGD